MSLRRVLIAVALVLGLCVWGFARSGHEAASARDADPVAAETEEADGDGTHDEAAARYRTNQSRHWRQVALGSATSH